MGQLRRILAASATCKLSLSFMSRWCQSCFVVYMVCAIHSSCLLLVLTTPQQPQHSHATRNIYQLNSAPHRGPFSAPLWTFRSLPEPRHEGLPPPSSGVVARAKSGDAGGSQHVTTTGLSTGPRLQLSHHGSLTRQFRWLIAVRTKCNLYSSLNHSLTH